MNKTREECLFDIIGEVDEGYIREYMEAQEKTRVPKHRKTRLIILLAAAMILLLGTVSLAAATPAIGHFLADLRSEQQAVLQNFDKIEATYAVPINDTQTCGGVTATLNSAVLEDRHLLLCYTFDWSGLAEAADGSFHTYFLPWFFYITEGDRVICRSEYTKALHTQTYPDNADDNCVTHIYCIDLENADGMDLIGKELTVRLLYAPDKEGFVSTFTPDTCFPNRSWNIGKTYTFGRHRIFLDRIQESALYVTLFVTCSTIGHPEDDYTFVLSDELGNHYPLYSNDDIETCGCWFTKPETMGTRLTLKVIRRGAQTGSPNETADSYEVLCEIPIELKPSFWESFFGRF